MWSLIFYVLVPINVSFYRSAPAITENWEVAFHSIKKPKTERDNMGRSLST